MQFTKRWFLIVLVVGLIILAAIIHIFHQPTTAVRIGYQRTLLYLPIFVADERGFFEEEGLKVKLERFNSANLMIQALLSRQIDVTGMSALNVLATVENEEPGQFKMFLFEVFTKKEHADHILVPVDSSVNDLSDLKGKRIGVHPGTTIKMYATMSLRQFLDTEKDVEFVELAPSLQVQAIASKQVDALFALEPVSAIAISKGYARDLGGFIAQHTIDPAYPGASVFSSDFIDEKKELAEKVQQAVYSAVDFIRENPGEAKKVLARYLGLEEEILPNLKLIGWVKTNEVDTSAIQQLLNIYAEHRIVDKIELPSNAYFKSSGE